MALKFGNVKKGEKVGKRPAYYAKTARAAQAILAKHHYKTVDGKAVALPTRKRLKVLDLHKLLEAKAPEALVGWPSFEAHSQYRKFLGQVLSGFYED